MCNLAVDNSSWGAAHEHRSGRFQLSEREGERGNGRAPLCVCVCWWVCVRVADSIQFASDGSLVLK